MATSSKVRKDDFREKDEQPGNRHASTSVKALSGILHRPGLPTTSVEEMDEAIGRHLAEDDERIQKGWR